MNARAVAVGVAIVIVIGGFVGFISFEVENVGASRGSILYVGGSGAGNFSTIQAAVDAANPGDTVYVYSGTYYEDVIINKTINLTGENRDTTIINGSSVHYPNDDVIIVYSNWVNISNFTIIDSGNWLGCAGIELMNVQNCTIDNNKMMYNNVGINFSQSSNNIVKNNIATLNYHGIYAGYLSNNNKIISNNISANGFMGISFSSSVNNTISGNNIINDGIMIDGDILLHFESHNVPTNNFVNNKPLFFYKNSNNLNIDGILAGQIILVNCTSLNLKNLNINNTDIGIEVAYSNKINISFCNISSNHFDGIKFIKSFNSTLLRNNFSFNNGNGLYFETSSNNKILENNILFNNEKGISFSKSYGEDKIIGNDILFNNHEGIRFLESCGNNSILHNNISCNVWSGLRFFNWLVFNYNNKIENNYISSNGLFGIELLWSSKNIIKNNMISNHTSVGISNHYSDNNTFMNNYIFKNERCLNLWQSSNNIIYHNNFINHNVSVDETGNNYWNEPYPTGGNYWSDYSGVDKFSGPNQNLLGSDGIGDTPYTNIVGEGDAKDNYPLMTPILINKIMTTPTAPSNLKASAGNGFINLTWNIPLTDGNSPISNYNIYRNKISGNPKFLFQTDNITYYNDTTVNNGVTYYYQLSAVNAIGEGPLSNEVSATPQGAIFPFTGRIHYVGGIGPGNYTRIQTAIEAANGSDTVFVFNDSAPYYENIVINKSINLIGENKETTIINGRGKGSVTKIFANKVNITGFTITNSGRNWWSFENQDCGIVIDGVQKCTIINNIISSKHYYGIGIQSSFNNSIMNNRVTSSYAAGGIALYSASYNNIVNNNLILSKGSGISITYFSNHNNIANNNVTSKYSGIYLQQTIKNNIKNNNLTNGGISIGGYWPSYYNSHNISTDNIVNEKPVYYYKNSKGITIDGMPVGQLIFASCTDINLRNLDIVDTNLGITIAYCTYFNITNNNISSNSARNIDIISSSNINIIGNSILNAYQSIQLYLSSKNNIINNNISFNSFSGIEVHTSFNNNIIGNKFLNNRFGIYLYSSWDNNVSNNLVSNNYRGFFIVESSNNNIIFNNISENREYGIYIEESSNGIMTIENITYILRSVNNKIYNNNFIPFIRYQACDKTNSNFWNSTYPTGGNYWSDYTGIDADGDGIGDTPYIIDDDSQDNYPLMEPLEINIDDSKNIKITLDLTKSEYYIGETIAGFINFTNDNPFDVFLNDLPWSLMVGIFFNVTSLDDNTYLDAVYNRAPIEVRAQSTLTIAFELYEMNTFNSGVYLHLPVGNYTIFSYFFHGTSNDYVILESNYVNFKVIQETSGVGDGADGDGGSGTGTFYQTLIFASATGLILFIIILSLFVTATEVGKYKFFATFVAPLYSRELKKRKKRYKDGYLRGKVHGYILGNPGESYNTIKKKLKLNNGALAYHLKVLEREHEVRSERDGLYKRFYPYEGKITDEILELSKLQKRIVNLVKRKPGQTQKQIAVRLKVPTQKINYHVKILEEARVLRLEREANKTRCYLLDDI